MTRVSVVMPAYNAAAYIGAAIASVQAQTLADWELIIVDDSSTDTTCEAVEAAAAGDSRIRLVRAERNGGVAAARNLGNAQACGDWIAVLDSDDAFEPSRLETLTSLAEAAGLDMIADNLLLVEFGKTGGPGHPHLPVVANGLSSVNLATWMQGNRPKSAGANLGYLKPLIRRAALVDHGLSYRSGLRVAEDCWLVADLLACGARFALCSQPLYRYALRPASLSRTYGDAAYRVQRPVYADFLSRHQGRLSRADIRAVRQHEQVLRDAEAFEGFAADIRSGRLLPGMGRLFARPGALRFLAGVPLARISRIGRRLGLGTSRRPGG